MNEWVRVLRCAWMRSTTSSDEMRIMPETKSNIAQKKRQRERGKRGSNMMKMMTRRRRS